MIKRFIIYLFAIHALAFGIVLNTKTELGVSSISSVPFVLSKISFLSLGQATMILYVIYILVQIFLLRSFPLKILLQIPFSFLFGIIVDSFDRILKVNPSHFFQSLLYLVLAIIITAFGAYLLVAMNLVLNPPDGIVNTIAVVIQREFGQVKLVFDCSMVSLSLVISWIFSHQFIGFGIGTIASALFIGQMISVFSKYLDETVQPIGHQMENSSAK